MCFNTYLRWPVYICIPIHIGKHITARTWELACLPQVACVSLWTCSSGAGLPNSSGLFVLCVPIPYLGAGLPTSSGLYISVIHIQLGVDITANFRELACLPQMACIPLSTYFWGAGL